MSTKGLQSSPTYERKYLIRRIGLEPIEITAEQRDGIVKSLEAGLKFVTIGERVIMLNAIQGVDPKYEPNNIPPRPKPRYLGAYETTINGKYMVRDDNHDLVPATPDNQDELSNWDNLFSSKQLEEGRK